MSKRLSAADLQAVAQVVGPPRRQEIDRTFGLPTALYGATFALYFGFLGTMAAAFMNPGMILPVAIIAVFLAAALIVPGKWVSMQPGSAPRAATLSQVAERGFQTLSGRLTLGEAAAQVLILPALIFIWGVVIAIIVATVG